VVRFLKLFTFLPMEQIEELARLEGADIRQAKQVLAFEVTKIVHGEAEASQAQQAAQAAFGGGDIAAEGTPSTMVAKERLKKGVPVFQLYTETGLCKSSSDARRLVKQGGAYLGQDRNIKVESFDETVTLEMAGEDGAIWLWAGKKRTHRVVPE
jgi:tyrosyl-tRNA synthetase